MSNTNLKYSPIFISRSSEKIQPEVLLLHEMVSNWTHRQFKDEWNKRFKNTHWEKLTRSQIYEITGVNFFNEHGVAGASRFLCTPDLSNNGNKGKFPTKGIVGATAEESRGRYLLLMTLVNAELK